jgi:hypothetical protein
MEQSHIIAEIQRTTIANRGAPLGWRRFEEETGIRYYDWYGRFWTRWGDAVRDAGFEPNRMTEAYKKEFLLEKLVHLTRSLSRVPTQGDILIAGKNDSMFPSEKTFRRLGPKPMRVSHVLAFCQSKQDLDDVAALWRQTKVSESKPVPEIASTESRAVGYVYLLKHGSRREYKIGRTYNPLRREGEIGIELPEKLRPVHYIETDDPAGIESYWHNRFAERRKGGEWFALSAEDVRSFKRWRKIY